MSNFPSGYGGGGVDPCYEFEANLAIADQHIMDIRDAITSLYHRCGVFDCDGMNEEQILSAIGERYQARGQNLAELRGQYVAVRAQNDILATALQAIVQFNTAEYGVYDTHEAIKEIKKIAEYALNANSYIK